MAVASPTYGNGALARAPGIGIIGACSRMEKSTDSRTFARPRRNLVSREGNKGPCDGRPVRRRSDPFLISPLDSVEGVFLEDSLNRSRYPGRISRFREHQAGASLQLANRMDAGRHDGQPGRDRLERDERKSRADEPVRENRDVGESIGGAQFLAGEEAAH